MMTLVAATVGGTIGACGSSTPTTRPHISSLHFHAGVVAGNVVPQNVDVALEDAAKAQAIYDATIDLPLLLGGHANCPYDPGIRYIIDFSDAQGPVVEAVLDPAGCSDVVIGSSPSRQIMDATYWSTIAQDLGIEEALIYPVAVLR
jgi:hypothetical protein